VRRGVRDTARMLCDPYEFNKASIGLLESLGFKKEGLKREAYFDGEDYANVIVLGLLEKDFH
jgi:ribosomal-protein-alanine N-acetyltransferase